MSTTSETCAAAAESLGVINSIASSPLMITLLLFAIPTAIWLVAYILPIIYMSLRPVPDLKKRYNASWALVTGAGSGIGKSLAFKLASQGLNVVVVSLDDDFLKETIKQLKEKYPDLQFRAVGCSFAPGVDYMAAIREATKDILVQIVFNNAGFLVTGFMDQTPIGKLLVNMECNATAGVHVTHHFVNKMLEKKVKGCIVFTSSAAGYIPTPFSAMYGATKAFVTQLASCLHVELYNEGIDVCVIHPSPVKSNFYQNLDHKVEMLEAAAKQAVNPDSLPDDMFRSIGGCALRDLGGMAMGVRMGTFFLPYNLSTIGFALAAPFLPDYKKHNKTRR